MKGKDGTSDHRRRYNAETRLAAAAMCASRSAGVAENTDDRPRGGGRGVGEGATSQSNFASIREKSTNGRRMKAHGTEGGGVSVIGKERTG